MIDDNNAMKCKARFLSTSKKVLIGSKARPWRGRATAACCYCTRWAAACYRSVVACHGLASTGYDLPRLAASGWGTTAMFGSGAAATSKVEDMFYSSGSPASAVFRL